VPGIQPKLTVNEPGDKYEKEAERVADAVMRRPEPEVDIRDEGRSDRIQRICPRCQRRYRQGKPLDCDECEAELQRKESSGETPAVGGEVKQHIQSLRGDGRPLPTSVRSFFEPRFGSDFSNVRVHDGPKADEAVQSLGAEAFTVGNNIAFADGNYDPFKSRGIELLAHELTHVIQQRKSSRHTLMRQNQEGDETNSDSNESRIRYFAPSPSREFLSQSEHGPVKEKKKEALSDDARNALYTQLGIRLGSAADDFGRACRNVQKDIEAKAKAQAELAAIAIDATVAFVVPNLSKAITRLAGHVPHEVPAEVTRAAIATINNADSIAGSIGEIGKASTKAAVKSALTGKAEGFCNAMIEGFQSRIDDISGYISANIQNRQALPDYLLLQYVANWDPGQITADRYEKKIRKEWKRWKRQVLAIRGPAMRERLSEQDITTQKRAFWVKVDGEKRLALLHGFNREGRLMKALLGPNWQFVTWIAPKFHAAAIARTKQVHSEGVKTISAKDVEGIPNKGE
jgi:hypothetical protein